MCKIALTSCSAQGSGCPETGQPEHLISRNERKLEKNAAFGAYFGAPR